MKKKLLTLIFTLALLIGLVAAMGMNASAVDVFNRNGTVSTPANLWNYAAQVYNGDTITLSGNITYDDKYDDEPYVLPFASDGDIVLDLNGYTIDITSRADSLIELDYGSTRLHIINSKAATTESKIIMRTKLGDASIVDLSNKNCSVYVYDGVELALGKEGDQAEAYRQTHVIKATAFSEIALYGGTVTNNIANGNGIKLISTNSVAFNNSTVILHGYAKIKANSYCIHLNDAFDYPTFRIGEATLDAGNNSLAISHYIGTAQQEVDNKKISDFFYDSGYGAYNLTAAEGGGRLENYMISSSTLIDNLAACDIKFKHTGAVYSCTHTYSSIINYPGGHYMACNNCGRFNTVEGHTEVGVEAATCTAPGYSQAGYDCDCGYKTAVVEAAKGHKYFEHAKKDPTCTEKGRKTTMYSCSACRSYFNSEKISVTSRMFALNSIDALGHDMVAVEAVAATCTKDGNIAHYDCSRCDLITSDAEGKNVITTAVISYPKTIELSATKYTYTGAAKAPGVTVKDAEGKTLVKGTDYTVTYPSAKTNAGTYTVTVAFKGNYSGTKTLNYTIAPDSSTKTVTLSATKYTYTGTAKAPGVTVKDSRGKTLTKGTDYTVAYSSGKTNVGKYAVTVTFKGNYSGTVTKYFLILPDKVTNLSATTTATTLKATWSKATGATGYKVEVINSSGTVVKTVHTKNNYYTFSGLTTALYYKVKVTSYKTIKDVNEYSLVYTSISTYTTPSTPTFSVTSTTKGKANFSWSDVNRETGYQVYYSTSENGTYTKAGTYAADSKSGSKSGLTSGKTYYFKVRAYKKVGDTVYYSGWSTIKSVKIK